MPRVAFQGEHGAYSELAAAMLWPGARCIPRRENLDVVQAVALGEATVGVLPIENNLAGTVMASVDALLAADDLHIVCEAVVPIRQYLLGVPGASLDDLRSAESHPVALAQCRTFLERHPAIEGKPVYDTAGAARDVALANDPRRGAVAGASAAALYGLSILLENIEDRPDNRTRFIGVSRTAARPSSESWCTTTIAITVDDPLVALSDLLRPIADAGLKGRRIATRPTDSVTTCIDVLDVAHRGGDSRLDDAVEA